MGEHPFLAPKRLDYAGSALMRAPRPNRQDAAEALKVEHDRKALQLWGQYQSEFGDESIEITPCKVNDGLLTKRRPPKRGKRSC